MRLGSQLLVVALLVATVTCNKSDENHRNQESQMKELMISVEGMACGSCASRVKKALVAMEGVGETHVSIEEKTLVTHYDPAKLSPERLVAAINGLGFKAGAPVAVAPR